MPPEAEARPARLIAVVGLVGETFGPGARDALRSATVLVGSVRQLAQARVWMEAQDSGRAGQGPERHRHGRAVEGPEQHGHGRAVEELVLRGPLPQLFAAIGDRVDAGEQVCVLASGDPGFFGIVGALSKHFGRERLSVHPAPSAVSLAFGRIGIPWDDAVVVSAHGRPLEDALARISGPKVAVLTSPEHAPEVVGAALRSRGHTAHDVFVVSRVGHEDEALVHTDLAGLADGHYDPMSVVVLLGDEAAHQAPLQWTAGGASGPTGEPRTLRLAEGPVAGRHALQPIAVPRRSDPRSPEQPTRPSEQPTPTTERRDPSGERATGWGLPESAFEHRAGMITKAEVRAVVLAKLALPATGVLWDVGAGSGSVAVECARLCPGLRVIAVERNAEDVARVSANAVAHGVAVEVVQGDAPAALAGLPDPDRVFVGGGGLEVLDAALGRLRPDGVVVATYALIGRAAAASERLGNLVQLTVARGVSTGDLGVRLSAEHPVFVCWGPGTP